MKPTVQILSKEMIKPSSPTPLHLSKMKLSHLDQLFAPSYVPFVFFYQANESSGLTCSNHAQISRNLKQSLSNTLTSFYPLAGTVEDGSLTVDCNDAGAEFIEARVDVHLADAIHEQNMDDLIRYAPPLPTDGKPQTLLLVQVTFFKCGGISITLCISHTVADVTSYMAFLSAWAATCRGQPDFSHYSFGTDNYFPSRDSPDGNSITFSVPDNVVAKRLVFDEEALMVLKQGATSPLVTNPTKVEAVSAFIWMHFMDMAKSETSSKAAAAAAASSIFPVVLPVNLRGRTNPPLSLENVFGNCSIGAMAFHDDAKSSGVSNKYQELVIKLRSLKKKVDHDYVMKGQDGNNYWDDLQQFLSALAKGELMETCCFSSLCGFPMYEINFGWGNPIWMCTPGVPGMNAFLFVKTKCGKGIEAWVAMENHKLELLNAQIQHISASAKRVGLARL